MLGYNKCQFMGNLTHDPELRSTKSGKSVTSFTLACNESWVDGQGTKQEKAEFVNCVAWGRSAEAIAEYTAKGAPLFVEGRYTTRKYEDKEGVTKWATEVVVQTFRLLSSRGAPGKVATRPLAAAPAADVHEETEDIPY